MQLDALPVEILSRICRFLGLQVFKYPGQAPIVQYLNKDFRSLRGTCKVTQISQYVSKFAKIGQELYNKTGYDAAVRYNTLLEELEIYVERSGFETLLQIVKVPAFRNRIYTIYFHVRDQHYEEFDPGDTTEPVCCAKLQALQASNESVRLLADCFKFLETAKHLQRIELNANYGHDLLLCAMVLARFSRKQFFLAIEPNHLARFGYGHFSSTPQTYLHYIKGLVIQPMFTESHLDLEDLSVKQREKNLLGLHIKNFRPTTTQLKDLISALDNLEALELNGCRSNPALRFCHGCDDLFVENFARTLYPHLSSLTINSMFISGGRLRRFIKRHSVTLTKVDIGYAMLTDGSWRSIAQGLAKLPTLSELRLMHLRQKHAAKHAVQPAPHHVKDSQVRLSGRSHVERFLRAFVAYFGTVQYLTHARVSGSPPIYHEAKLFRLPNEPIVSGQLKAVAVMRKYAGVSGSQ